MSIKTREIRLKISFDTKEQEDPALWDWLSLLEQKDFEVEYHDGTDWIPLCEVEDYQYLE